jgi:hypothetical protein
MLGEVEWEVVLRHPLLLLLRGPQVRQGLLPIEQEGLLG